MAIYNPKDLKFDDKNFSLIIYGSPGVGKTTLACSAPSPLLIDLDKGISRIKAQHRVLASVIEKYEELEEDFKSDEFKNCKTVIIDTGGALITYLQDYVMRKDTVNKTKMGTLSLKGFGAVKQEFLNLTNRLKTVYNKNVIYVFHSIEEKDKDGNPVQRLMCEGSARNLVWQPCDFGCYVQMQNGGRVACFSPTEEYFAKGCYGVSGTMAVPALSDTSKNDFITQLFDRAKTNIAAENTYFEAEEKEYNKVMEEGKKIVDAVNDIESANAVGGKFKGLIHRLTSEAELRALLSAKLKDLGLAWDKEQKTYKQKEVQAQ